MHRPSWSVSKEKVRSLKGGGGKIERNMIREPVGKKGRGYEHARVLGWRVRAGGLNWGTTKTLSKRES